MQMEVMGNHLELLFSAYTTGKEQGINPQKRMFSFPHKRDRGSCVMGRSSHPRAHPDAHDIPVTGYPGEPGTPKGKSER